MTTADWALVISIISAIVSAASFLWNVWSKFIYPKSRAEVSYSYVVIGRGAYLTSLTDDEDIARADAICLRITNLGPSDLSLYASALGKLKWRRWRWKREVSTVLNPIDNFPTRPFTSTGPFSGGVQKKLAAGDHFELYLPATVDLDRNKHRYIGFQDTFGRNHWARIRKRKA